MKTHETTPVHRDSSRLRNLRRSQTWNVVDAAVDDHRSLLDPLSLHHLCFTDADHQDVRLPHLDIESKG